MVSRDMVGEGGHSESVLYSSICVSLSIKVTSNPRADGVRLMGMGLDVNVGSELLPTPSYGDDFDDGSIGTDSTEVCLERGLFLTTYGFIVGSASASGQVYVVA